ncbi:hypothetical protein [Paenibacillus macquariensis]|uniref:Uncharacterized protein n=1 Tax=Paenibacillus macquariensis TaxID=948756 RepID=A0ABY1JKF7_9BACL|nr:hypothetical protein [Paenibacillus macquariensis]MEC0089922.1 hypothetical protein [Paenibacillus macquariensis]OAB31187.1 hypothetical protein PMSM_20935 [Paenibacillus macquariensis subsp. macquariensis]SIQ34383.1 hypothetical protein SAMN05421578_101309 [Paenibacillus macquariensis]
MGEESKEFKFMKNLANELLIKHSRHVEDKIKLFEEIEGLSMTLEPMEEIEVSDLNKVMDALKHLYKGVVFDKETDTHYFFYLNSMEFPISVDKKTRQVFQDEDPVEILIVPE